MAVIGISIEPSGRTRVMFDFRATDEDPMTRIEHAMLLSRPQPENGVADVQDRAEKITRSRPRRVVPAFR